MRSENIAKNTGKYQNVSTWEEIWVAESKGIVEFVG